MGAVMPRDIKEIIFSAIGRDPVPIYVIANNAGVSVQTASKYCYILQAEGRILMQKFGNMNLVKKAVK
jgi:hypothetical protein